MSANDDDLGGDDDQLNQLRSVWVSMRESDADPPDRGLDALMAAARTKAADMAPPASEGFWAKVLAVFRRPPVLALASITVLLGGALFIAQRRDTMQVDETVADRQERAAPVAAPAMPDRFADPAPEPTKPGPGVAPPPAEISAPTPVEAPREVVTQRPRPTVRRPGAVASSTVETENKRIKADEGGERADEAPTATVVVGGATQADEKVAPTITRGAVARPPEATPATEALGGPQTKLAMDNDLADASTADRAKDSQLTQLVKQCESAAARNDCPAVRVLAKKIKSANADAYKQRVANNTAIARCLE